jgi:hypothetical protein
VAATADSYPQANPRLDWASAILGFAFMCGLIGDGWSHAHYVTDTYFTLPHAMFFSAFMALAAVTIVTGIQNRRLGYSWKRMLPRGYGPSFWAALLFFPGLPADMVWHLINGPEKSLAVLLSPTHLYLAACIAVMMTGPLRAALAAPPEKRFASQLPMLISACAFFMLLQFFTQYAFAFDAGFSRAMAPAGYQDVDRSGNLTQIVNVFYRQIEGLFAIVVHAVLIAGFVVFLARSFRLVPGTFTLLFTVGIATIAAMTSNDPTTYAVNVLDGLLTGIIADALYAAMRPSDAIGAFRAFATLVPAIHFALFWLLEAVFVGGTWWQLNLVLGSIVIAAVIGLLLSVLAALPSKTALSAA